VDRKNEKPAARNRRKTAPLFFALVVCVLPVLIALPAHSQMVQFDAGTSTLFQATGGSMHVRTPDSEAAIGFGFLNGDFTSGGLYRHKWNNMTFTFGDDPIPVRLPTDLFDSSHYFFGRGASVAVESGQTRIFTFAGLTSNGISAPFFSGGTFGQGTGALFLDHTITKHLQLTSRNIFSSRQTSVSGLEWTPMTSLKLNTDAGVGANQRYFGSSVVIETAPVSLRAGYVDAGEDFQRVLVTTPLTSENVGANALLTVRPLRNLSLTAGHFDLMQPQTLSTAAMHATLNQYSTNYALHNTSFNGSLYRSETGGLGTTGSSLSVNRILTSRFQAGASLFHSREDRGPSLTSFIGMLREVLCPRLTLAQVVNHSNGSTNFSWGGDFLSNPITVGVNYQTVYSPFFPNSPFRQLLLLNLHLQPTHLFQVTTATYVGIDGTVKYSTYGGLLGYRGDSDPAAPSHFKFPRYIVQGKVVDQNGDPVRGAALKIDKELVFSDEDGEFFTRRKHRHAIHIDVELKDFAVAGNFSVRSCPSTAWPALPDSAATLVVVLEHYGNSARPH
jgi:hypothetical protein